MRHLLWYKLKRWSYENEYRIIIEAKNVKKPGEYFQLQNPIKKIFVGIRGNKNRVDILKKAVRGKAELIYMDLDKYGLLRTA